MLSTPWRNNNCYEDLSGQKLFYRTTPTSRGGQEEWHPGSYNYNTTAATSATIESHAEWVTQPADQPDKYVPHLYNSTIQNATNSGSGDWMQRIRYAYVTQAPGSPYNPNRECSQFPRSQTNSDPIYNITDPLFESAWRGNWGWSRTVAIDASGAIQWASAGAWTGPISIGGLPGSGDMQSEVNYRVGDNLVQGVWRSNQGWTRNIPIVNGVIQWASAPAWSGPISINGLPGSGDMQAHGDYAVGNTLIQAVWRSNQGWSRNAPIVNGVVQWGQAGSWSGPLSISTLSGSGDMQAQDNYVIGNTYWQIIWRNNTQWTRSAPIINGVVRFDLATLWSNTTSQENLPGSGNVQAQGNYVFP